MRVSYNWLQEYIVEELPSPEKLADFFTFHAWEIDEQNLLPNSDTVYDLKILPDRAHDCLGHYGIAREVSALLGFTLRKPSTHADIAMLPEGEKSISVIIQSPLCRRYMARVIRGVKIGESPEWLKLKLESIGQRSVNNVVDATNYVQFALGQPTHVFDLGKIQQTHNGRKVIEINETVGERPMTLLDGKEITLRSGTLIISDMGTISDLNHRAIAVAGIKGSKAAEVDSNTIDIVLEVANFDPISVRKTARALGITTDASKRFENELSPELCPYAMQLLTDTIMEIAGGARESVVDIYPTKQTEVVVECTVEYVASRLGMNVTGADIANTLQVRGFAYVERDNLFSITVPWWRLDITGAHDIIEEIGKQIGYDRIIPRLPIITKSSQLNTEFYWIERIREFLLQRGFSEVMTYSFTNHGEVEVLASASDKSFLRTNISEQFSEALIKNFYNRDLLGFDEIKQFEIGKTFENGIEKLVLCIGVMKQKQKDSNKELFEISRSLAESFDLGYSLESIPENQTTIDLSLEYLTKTRAEREVSSVPELLKSLNPNPFIPWSPYPCISRDIAVWVPENTDPNLLVAVYRKYGGVLLVREPRLFDQFSKEGRASYAHRLVFQSYEKTLADTDVQPIMNAIVTQLVSNGWEVR